ncbi:MAG TPA: hypothetical protein VN026_12790 [Bacteroidia bacterium]|nr:hypothetical protein [Bacteroidia bacterium]
MPNDTQIQLLIDKLEALQASVNIIAETVDKMKKEKMALGDWTIEKEVIAVTRLSRSKLLDLRKTGKVSSSSFNGKTPYYRLSDFKKLLDKNER